MSQVLADKIRDFITGEERPVAYEQILARGRMHGLSVQVIHEALRIVHTFKDIERTARLGTVYYRPRPVREGDIKLPRRKQTEEEKQEYRDFWENSPLVTEEERECYFESLKDKNRHKTCGCESCVSVRWLLLNEKERAVVRWNEEREFLKTLNSGLQTDTGIKSNERGGPIPAS